MSDNIFTATKNGEPSGWPVCWTGQGDDGSHFGVSMVGVRGSQTHEYSQGAEGDAQLIAALLDRYYSKIDEKKDAELHALQSQVLHLEDFIRTRNVVCTYCGFKVVYSNEDDEEKQAARDKVNAHALVCEKDPRNVELHALQERVKDLEKVKEIAQKIYDVSEQDGRYGDGSYALVLRDEYENSVLLVKLGETLESMKVSA